MPNRDRLPPIPEAEMSEAQRKAVAEVVAGPRGRLVGPFYPLMRSPELMTRVQKVGEYLRFGSILPAHLREFAILITARQWTQHYEWHFHRSLALEEGLEPAIVQALAEGRIPEGMRREEAIVYAFCDELERVRSVADATYRRALEAFGEQGVVELTALTGYYAMLARIMNVARTPLPQGTESSLPLFPG